MTVEETVEEEFNLDQIDGEELCNDLSLQIAQLSQQVAMQRQQLTRARRRILELTVKLKEFGVEAEAPAPEVTMSTTRPARKSSSPRKTSTRKRH